MLTPELLRAVGVRSASASTWAPHLAAAAPHADITTPLRVAAWVAQIAHESGRLVYVSEIWGPTAVQRRYEGRADLGNVQQGDGQRFLGRGPIQVTGRANYRMVRDELRAAGIDCPDFEAVPKLLENPQWGALAAAAWWRRNKVNAYADSRNIAAVSSLVNRGRVGLPALGAVERATLFAAACRFLGI